MAQHYTFKASRVFEGAFELAMMQNNHMPVVSAIASNGVSSASNGRAVTPERMENLGKILAYPGDHDSGSDLKTWYDANPAIDKGDVVLYDLLFPKNDKGEHISPPADNLAEVRAIYSSVAPQVSSLASANDQALSGDVQTLMAAVTSGTTAISAENNMLQAMAALYNTPIKL